MALTWGEVRSESDWRTAAAQEKLPPALALRRSEEGAANPYAALPATAVLLRPLASFSSRCPTTIAGRLVRSAAGVWFCSWRSGQQAWTRATWAFAWFWLQRRVALQ